MLEAEIRVRDAHALDADLAEVAVPVLDALAVRHALPLVADLARAAVVVDLTFETVSIDACDRNGPVAHAVVEVVVRDDHTDFEIAYLLTRVERVGCAGVVDRAARRFPEVLEVVAFVVVTRCRKVDVVAHRRFERRNHHLDEVCTSVEFAVDSNPAEILGGLAVQHHHDVGRDAHLDVELRRAAAGRFTIHRGGHHFDEVVVARGKPEYLHRRGCPGCAGVDGATDRLDVVSGDRPLHLVDLHVAFELEGHVERAAIAGGRFASATRQAERGGTKYGYPRCRTQARHELLFL